MKWIKIPATIFLLTITIGSCKKNWLDQPALGELDESKLANKRGVEGLLIAAYSLLDGFGSTKSDVYGAASTTANWIFGSISATEAYTGVTNDLTEINAIEEFSATSENSLLAAKWGTLYDGVQRANDVLRLMKKATDISTADQLRIEAEARFLRGFYHFEAKKIWNNIPYADENVTYENGNYRIGNEKDAWPFIEADLLFAKENLPEAPYQQAIGRAVRLTATALLAKAFIFQRKFAAARPLLEEVINSGKYSLGKYSDNFNLAVERNPESVFFAMMSVNDGAGGSNGNYGNVLTYVMFGPGGCCGYFRPSQYLVNHFKTDPITGLPDLDNFNNGDVKNDEGIPSGDPFTPYEGELDPRLDWTVGRRGIPFLDWGVHPGQDWRMFSEESGGPYTPKKNAFPASVAGKQTDASFWGSATSATFNIIRYAEIILWAAEVEIETGNFQKGIIYINQLRNRAAEKEGWVKNNSGPFAPFAANYKILPYSPAEFTTREQALKALRYERVLELGMEGHRFFDLVRWGIAKEEMDAYLLKEKVKRAHLSNTVFKKGCNEFYPIPVKQIDLSAGADGQPAMKQNPCY